MRHLLNIPLLLLLSTVCASAQEAPRPALQATASVALDNSGASGYIQVVPALAGQRIYVVNWSAIASGTTNFQFVYGTGSNCGTGTVELTGQYALVAQAGLAVGSTGAQLITPVSQALCINVVSAVQVSGHIAYTQF
jgi:ABC-type Fe3+-hydroxamate transport system substrate-binding protein